MGEKAGEVILIVVGTVAMLALIGLGLAFPLKWCWNYVMPYLFGLGKITWGQAWCLHFIAGMLIKSSLTTKSK